MINTIYYHPQWGELQQEKENGEHGLFRFKTSEGEIVYPFIKRLAGTLDGKKYYDLATPRGEAGPLLVSGKPEKVIDGWRQAMAEYCRRENIIAEYVRFDPWNDNAKLFGDVYRLQPHGYAYCYPLTEDWFFTQYSVKRRNQIRKAMSSGVELEWSQTPDSLDAFMRLYRFTEDKHSVSGYYRLTRPFLETYFSMLGDRVYICTAYLGTHPVASAMFLNGGDVFHYHFSASDPDHLQTNAISYILSDAAKVGADCGCTLMDLGGATVGSGLEKFKRSFMKPEQVLSCFVGTLVCDKAACDRLEAQNGTMPPGYFPPYRRSL